MIKLYKIFVYIIFLFSSLGLISCASKKTVIKVLPPQCGEVLYNDMTIRKMVEPNNMSEDLVFSELSTNHKDIYCGLSGDKEAAMRAAHEFFVGSHNPDNLSDKRSNVFLEIAARQDDVEAQKLLHRNYYEKNGANNPHEMAIWEYVLFTHGYKTYNDFINKSQEETPRHLLRDAEYRAYSSTYKEYMPFDELMEKYGIKNIID